ncbi:MAG: hypothetical protein ACKVW3_02390 [Phycisphaerales bacterium]
MARRKSTSGGLATISNSALQAELSRRSQKVRGLMQKHRRAQAVVARLEAQIREHGGEVDGRFAGSRKRPKNDQNLVESLAALLKGKTMSVTEASEEVQRAGYKTSSDNFRTIVNQTLIKSNLFRKVSRGQYTAK